MNQVIEKPARYISRYLKLKIVMKPTHNQVVEGRVVTTQGKRIDFDGGVYETTDKDEQAFLEARPEFGRIIIKAPADIEDLAGARDEWTKDLETREAELKASQDALKAEKVRLGMDETGKGAAGTEDELDSMTKAQLLEVAAAEGVEGVSKTNKNEEIVEAIKAKRTENPAFTE